MSSVGAQTLQLEHWGAKEKRVWMGRGGAEIGKKDCGVSKNLRQQRDSSPEVTSSNLLFSPLPLHPSTLTPHIHPGAEDWAQTLGLHRQVLYHWAKSPTFLLCLLMSIFGLRHPVYSTPLFLPQLSASWAKMSTWKFRASLGSSRGTMSAVPPMTWLLPWYGEWRSPWTVSGPASPPPYEYMRLVFYQTCSTKAAFRVAEKSQHHSLASALKS